MDRQSHLLLTGSKFSHNLVLTGSKFSEGFRLLIADLHDCTSECFEVEWKACGQIQMKKRASKLYRTQNNTMACKKDNAIYADVIQIR